MTNATEHPGRSAAYKLAFFCFADNIPLERFRKYPIAQQVLFAEGVVGISAEELADAIGYIADYNLGRLKAIERYLASH